MGIQIADVSSGSNNAIIGILSAVICRSRTGRGQHIDISMTDGMIALNAMFGANFLVDGEEPVRESTMINGGSLYDFYETGDGGYISVGSLEHQFFTAFCQTINCPDLIPEGIYPLEIYRIKEQIRDVIKSKTRDEWIEIFRDVDACVEPVLSVSEALNDDHAKERALVVDVKLPDGRSVKQLANPIKFSETPPEYGEVGVPAGLHTEEVLHELGYKEGEIEDFRKTGLFS